MSTKRCAIYTRKSSEEGLEQVIKPDEAETLRQIYRKYLELGCVRLLQKHLATHDVRSVSGNIIARSALYKILSNPIYIGQIRHKGICHPGQHAAIIDQELWNQVQQHRANNTNGNTMRTRKSDRSLLAHKLFDASGEQLVPSYANKKGMRYRYYISRSLKTDTAEHNRQGWRLPAQEIEQVVAHAASEILKDDHAITSALQEAGIAAHYIPEAIRAASNIPPTDIIDRFVQHIKLSPDGMCITLSLVPLMDVLTQVTITHDVPMQMQRRGVEMRLIVGGHSPARIDQALVKTIARAHQWFNDLATGRIQNMAAIASREGTDKSYIARIIDLAFLSPDITERIIAGQYPADLTIHKLTKHLDISLDWSQQRQLLGFA